MASFGAPVMALTGYQVAETQLYLADSTRAVLSSMTMATRFSAVACLLVWEKMWRFGCPKSPDWDSKMEMKSVKEEERKSVMDHLRQVIEPPVGFGARVLGIR